MAKVDPGQVNVVLSSGGKDDYIAENALNSVKKPGSLDYYAIAMTTMIALYAAIASSQLMNGERTRRTAIRLMAAPITKIEIFAGKIMGSIVLNSLCLLIVVLFSKFVFKAYWGVHLGMVALVLLTEVILAISLGLGLSAMIKNEAARPVIMVFTQLASIFGGAYFPMDNTPGLVNSLTYLSPIRWANTAITQIIYENDLAAAIPAILFNVGVTAVFLIIAGTALQKREGL